TRFSRDWSSDVCSSDLNTVKIQPADGAADAFRHMLSPVSTGTRQHHNKFFTTITGQQIGTAVYGLTNSLRHHPQNFITSLMAMHIVHLFEVINVDHQDTDRLAGADGAGHFALHNLVKKAPVTQIGER